MILQALVWAIAGRNYRLAPLSQRAAEEDAKHFLPIVEAHPALAVMLSWIGAPIVIVRRVARNLRRKVEPQRKAA